MVRYSLMACLAVGVACIAAGCNKSSEYKTVDAIKKASPLPDHDHDHGHDHGEKGPHGGGIIELGEEEYHAEILVDHDTHAVSLFVLGKDAKTAESVAAPEVTVTPQGKDALTLKAAPQEGDAAGKFSKFELISDDVVHDLMDAGILEGELRITIADKPYIGHIHYHLKGDAHDHGEKKPDDGAK